MDVRQKLRVSLCQIPKGCDFFATGLHLLNAPLGFQVSDFFITFGALALPTCSFASFVGALPDMWTSP